MFINLINERKYDRNKQPFMNVGFRFPMKGSDSTRKFTKILPRRRSAVRTWKNAISGLPNSDLFRISSVYDGPSAASQSDHCGFLLVVRSSAFGNPVATIPGDPGISTLTEIPMISASHPRSLPATKRNRSTRFRFFEKHGQYVKTTSPTQIAPRAQAMEIKLMKAMLLRAWPSKCKKPGWVSDRLPKLVSPHTEAESLPEKFAVRRSSQVRSEGADAFEALRASRYQEPSSSSSKAQERRSR